MGVLRMTCDDGGHGICQFGQPISVTILFEELELFIRIQSLRKDPVKVHERVDGPILWRQVSRANAPFHEEVKPMADKQRTDEEVD